MPNVYDSENFQGRVNFAAKYITEGRSTTRSFDTCFEMWDGDAVFVALHRRAEKNAKLAQALPRYLVPNPDLITKYNHIPTRRLKDEAQKLRARFSNT